MNTYETQDICYIVQCTIQKRQQHLFVQHVPQHKGCTPNIVLQINVILRDITPRQINNPSFNIYHNKNYSRMYTKYLLQITLGYVPSLQDKYFERYIFFFSRFYQQHFGGKICVSTQCYKILTEEYMTCR